MSEITRGFKEPKNEMYRFAGQCLNTRWEFPNGSEEWCQKAVVDSSRYDGGRMTHIDLVFETKTIHAEGFHNRINPKSVGDVKPAESTAAQLVESL